MSLTVFEGYEFLQEKLKADATIQATFGSPARVYQRNAPEGIPVYPLLLIRFVSAIPLVTLGAIDVHSSALFDVIGVTRDNSTASIKAGVNRVDALLNRASGTTAAGEIFFVHKADLTEIATTDPPSPGGGARIQNLGRTWRLILQGA